MDLGNDKLDGGDGYHGGAETNVGCLFGFCGWNGLMVLVVSMIFLILMVLVVLMPVKLILKVKLEDWAGFPLTTLSIWNKYKDVSIIAMVTIITIITTNTVTITVIISIICREC